MDIISQYLTEAEEWINVGNKYSDQGKKQDAYLAISQAIYVYQTALAEAMDEEGSFKDSILRCLLSTSKLLENLRLEAFQQHDAKSQSLRSTGGYDQECAGPSDKKRDHWKDFQGKLERWTPGKGLKSIIGLANLKSILCQCLLLLPESRFRPMFAKSSDSRFEEHLLLVGAPGNGKTVIVKHYHQEAKGTNLIRILPSDIFDSYVGEGEKRLDTLFRVAKENSPTIIFIDEIEGIFGTQRRDGFNISLVDQFLQILRESPGVQVIAATNYPWELEEAIRRRFDHVVHVPMPNLAERVRVFRHYMGEAAPSLTDDDFTRAGKLTKGYSCSDLERATKKCLKSSATKITNATYFRKMKGYDCTFWEPCSGEAENAEELRFTDILDVENIRFPSIQLEDLLQAITQNKKSSQDAAQKSSLQARMLAFAHQFATDGRSGTAMRKLKPTGPQTKDSCIQVDIKNQCEKLENEECQVMEENCPSAFDLRFRCLKRDSLQIVLKSTAMQTGTNQHDRCLWSHHDHGKASLIFEIELNDGSRVSLSSQQMHVVILNDGKVEVSTIEGTKETTIDLDLLSNILRSASTLYKFCPEADRKCDLEDA